MINVTEWETADKCKEKLFPLKHENKVAVEADVSIGFKCSSENNENTMKILCKKTELGRNK